MKIILKTSYLAVCLLILMLLTGCRYSFELRDSAAEPRICLMSYICEGEDGEIEIYRTVPVNEAGSAAEDIISPSYSLKCNGEEVETSFEMIGNKGLKISHPGFRCGDRIEITASADGIETAKASTTVPEHFPAFTQEFRFDEDGNRSILIEYEEEEGRNYYGAAVEYNLGQKNPYTRTLGFALPIEEYDKLSLDKDAYSPVVAYVMDRHIFVWDEEEDGQYEIKFTFNNYTSKDNKYRLHLYRLSEEMFRKLNAEYDANVNPFAGLGMSSPSFTYTNIGNGVGYFCSCSSIVSDWMAE